MIARTNPHRRSRAKQRKPYIPRSHDTFPASITIDPATNNVIRLQAAERLIILPNLPNWTALNTAFPNDPEAPILIDAVGPDFLAITFPGGFAPYDRLIVAAQDPTIRNYTGGYITAGNHPTFQPADIVPLTIVGNDPADTITITTPVPINVLGNCLAYVATPLVGPQGPPTAAVQLSPTSYRLDFPPGTDPVGGTLDIPAFDPDIRGIDGAYIATNTYPVT